MTSFRVFVLVLVAWSPLSAAQSPVAERPSFKVGDAWTWQRTQTRPPPGATAPPVWTRRIVEITPEGNVRTGNQRGPTYFDASLNVIADAGDEYKRISFVFPLTVGKEWTWSRKVYPEYPDVVETGDFEVQAFETITVPAGTFECFRIHGEMRLTGRHIGTWTKSDTWYCPAIRHVGKMIVTINETRPLNGGPGVYNTETSELLRSTAIGAAK